MRAATYSKKKVRCPNSQIFAYSKGTAEVGNWIVYKEHYEVDTENLLEAGEVQGGAESYRLRVGRMFGRVESAEFVERESKPPTGFIAVLVLSDDLSHAHVRWIDPKNVVESQPHAQGRQAFLHWFAGDWPKELRPDVVCSLSEYGTLGWNYISGVISAALAFTHGVGVEALRRFGLEEAKRLCGKE